LSAMDAERVESSRFPGASPSTRPSRFTPRSLHRQEDRIAGGPAPRRKRLHVPAEVHREYENPRYYAGRPDSWPFGPALAASPAISTGLSRLDQPQVGRVSSGREFAVSTMFAYRSLIRIYSPTQNTAHLGRDGNG
jgi:hypothetical protein